MRRAALCLAITLGAALLAGAGASTASAATCDRPAFPWQRPSVRQDIAFPSQGATVTGSVFAPASVAQYPGKRPVIVAMHGNNGSECGQWWFARSMAGVGYVVATITTPGTANENARSLYDAITYLGTSGNPYLARSDLSRIGATGHSEGSGAIAIAQAWDERIDAIVAFDNLKRYWRGDPGAYVNCTPPQSQIARAHAPALGLASDVPCVNNPAYAPPGLKKTGFDFWRSQHVPAVELVLRGAAHESFSQNAQDVTGSSDEVYYLRTFNYAWGWFQRFLDGNPYGTSWVLSPRPLGLARGDVLSNRFTSAAYVDGIDCADLASCPAAPGS